MVKLHKLKDGFLWLFFAIILLCCSMFGIFFKDAQKKQQAYAFDPVSTATFITLLQGGLKAVGVCWAAIDGASDSSHSDGQRTKDFFAAIFDSGTQVTDAISDVKKKVNEIDGKIDTITTNIAKLKSDMKDCFDNVLSNINQAVENIEVTLNKSIMTMQDWLTIKEKVDAFINKYSSVRTTLKSVLNELKASNTYYKDIINLIKINPNGESILKVVDKISYNFNKSYNSLLEDEKKLLDTKLTYKNTEVVLKNYLEQHINFIYNTLLKTYNNFIDGYSIDMYTSILNYADYILGRKDFAFANMGIGEVFYKLCVMSCETSIDAHSQYRNFSSYVLYDYYLMSYVCNLYFMNQKAQLLQEENVNNDAVWAIQNRMDTLKCLNEEVLMFMDSEYKSCKIKYDYDNIDFPKNTQPEDYVVYYGNSKNKVNNSIDKNTYVLKKDFMPNMHIVNEQYIVLAGGESFNTKVFYGYNEVQKQLNWKSENPEIATVSKDGKITGLATGETTVGTTVGDIYYPLVSVFVTRASLQNGTNTNEDVYRVKSKDILTQEDVLIEKKFKGSGKVYNYNTVLFSSNISFDTSTNNTFDFRNAFGIKQSDYSKYSILNYDEDIKVVGHMAYCTSATSGCISIKKFIDGEEYIINVPVYNKNITTGVVNYQIEDEQNVNTNSPIDTRIYIKSKKDLLDLRTFLIDAFKTEEVTYRDNIRVYFLNDIDMEGESWSAIDAFGYNFVDANNIKIIGVDIFGNGHKIKNIKFTRTLSEKYNLEKEKDKENKDVYTEKKYNIYGLFDNFAGSINNLEVENVKYENILQQDNQYKNLYYVFAKDFINYYRAKKVDKFYFAQMQTRLNNLIVSGEIIHNVSNNFSFSPFVGRDHINSYKENYIESNYALIENCIYKANTLFDCNGLDIFADIAVYKNNYNFLNSIFAGSIKVVNILDNNKVELLKNKYLALINSVILSVNKFSVKNILSNKFQENISLNNVTKEVFWKEHGYTEHNFVFEDIYGFKSIPTLVKKGVYANLRNFKTKYLLNEKLDIDNFKVYDDNKLITSLGTFEKIDTSVVGEKEIVFRYNKTTIRTKVVYEPTALPIFVKYEKGENGNGLNIEKVAKSGVNYQLLGETFTRVGYKQTGWQNKDNPKQTFNLSSNQIFYQDITLIPVWEAQLVNVKVKYYYQNVDDNEYTFVSEEDSKYYADGFLLVNPAEPKGFVVKEHEAQKINPDGTSVINIYFDRIIINVTFDFDKEVYKMEDNKPVFKYKYGQTIKTCPAKYVVNKGYEHKGFDKTFEVLTQDITYSAVFKQLHYTITFIVENEVVLQKNDYVYNQQIVEPKTPTKKQDDEAKYEFAGWGEDYTGKVVGTKTYTAKFNKIYIDYLINNDYIEQNKNSNNGYVTWNGVNHFNQKITINIFPNDGYRIDVLKVNNNTIQTTNNQASFILKGDSTIYCEFIKILQTIEDESDTLKEVKLVAKTSVIPMGSSMKILKQDKTTSAFNNARKILNKDIVLSVYEINIKNSLGEDLTKLTDTVELSLKIPNNNEKANLKVYRIEDNKIIEYEYVEKNGYLVINTDHFSTYVIAKVDNSPLVIGISVSSAIVCIITGVFCVVYIKKKKLKTLNKNTNI